MGRCEALSLEEAYRITRGSQWEANVSLYDRPYLKMQLRREHRGGYAEGDTKPLVHNKQDD